MGNQLKEKQCNQSSTQQSRLSCTLTNLAKNKRTIRKIRKLKKRVGWTKLSDAKLSLKLTRSLIIKSRWSSTVVPRCDHVMWKFKSLVLTQDLCNVLNYI